MWSFRHRAVKGAKHRASCFFEKVLGAACVDRNVYLNAYEVKAFGFGANLSLNDLSSVPHRSLSM